MSDTFLNDFLDQPEKADAAPAAVSSGASASGVPTEVALEEQVIDQLKTIYDPEIPVNIYELGLIYAVDVTEEGKVDVTMTLTTPMCPVAESMPGDVEAKIREIDGVSDVTVDLVWEPPWDMSKLTEAAKLELGML